MRIEPHRLIEVLNSLFALIQYAVTLASLMVGLSHLRREFNGLVKTGNSTLSVTFASPVHALSDLFLSLCDFFSRVFRRNSDNARHQNHKPGQSDHHGEVQTATDAVRHQLIEAIVIGSM